MRALSARREDTRLGALIEARITISRGPDLDETLGRLVELARELTDARYGALGVLDETRTRARRASRGTGSTSATRTWCSSSRARTP